jgi:hypothetical protein
MSLVSASSSVFCSYFLFFVLIVFLRFLITLLLALFVSGEIKLVSCISCLALFFQSRVLLSACFILAFHHSLDFSEGCAILLFFVLIQLGLLGMPSLPVLLVTELD